MYELKEKLESIEVLLQANIAKMNKIVAEANDPKKKAEEAQILIEASKSINSSTNEMKGLILAQKKQIEGFNPKVEVKHYNIDFKKPLAWIVLTIVLLAGAIYVAYLFYDKMEMFKERSITRRDNYYKYEHLRYFGSKQTQMEIKNLDRRYSKDWEKIDSLTRAEAYK